MKANCGLVTTTGAPHTRTPFFRAASSSSMPAACELAIGFSLQTCLPAAMASRLRCSCSCMSVRFTSKSKSAPASICRNVRVVVGDVVILGLVDGPFGNDVAGAHQFDVRAFGEVRQSSGARRCRSR